MTGSNEYSNDQLPESNRRARWLLAAVLALAVSNALLFWRLDRQRKDFDGQISAMQQTMSGEISGLRNLMSMAARASQGTEEKLRQELDAARRQAAVAAGKAKIDAVRHAEELAQRLAAEQKKQQQQQELVASELSGLKEVANTTHARVTEVSGDVKHVRSELETTIAELKSVRGDLGIQSGLIATNAKELAALKALGERNYYEFSLAKTKQPQAVGNIRLALQNSDPRRNKYTVSVVADDKRIEKRDKTVNEPVQFYVLGSRLPYELVVNQVHKDRIVGYLATPKSMEIASR
jgi:hypothetical protein